MGITDLYSELAGVNQGDDRRNMGVPRSLEAIQQRLPAQVRRERTTAHTGPG